MRFESKNAQIKGFVSHCFRNVPLSVSIHHQQWMCYQLLTSPGQATSNILYPGDHIVSGNIVYCITFYCRVAHIIFLVFKGLKKSLMNMLVKYVQCAERRMTELL